MIHLQGDEETRSQRAKEARGRRSVSSSSSMKENRETKSGKQPTVTGYYSLLCLKLVANPAGQKDGGGGGGGTRSICGGARVGVPGQSRTDSLRLNISPLITEAGQQAQ